jgi:hypothetical protein
VIIEKKVFMKLQLLKALGLMALILSGCSKCSRKETTVNSTTQTSVKKSLPDILGTTHTAGNYYLTDKDYLNEGADQVLAMGSHVIKVWFYGKRNEHPEVMYPFNSNWPKANSLVDGAKLPYFKTLFNKPFTTYILVVTSLGRSADYWRDGITKEQEKDEQRQFYELAKHFLTTYKDSGKTFVLQHWEGDWMTRGHFNLDEDPRPEALANMVIWLNARQAGVNQAKKEIGQHGVRVYSAAEVNRVVSSMQTGRPNIVNKVLPYTNVDLVSYSSWDSCVDHYNDPNVLRSALDFIAANVPDSPDFGSKNVYLGEFGLPENEFSPERVQQTMANVVDVGLAWGCPYIVYWELYCNELKPDKQTTPGELPTYQSDLIPRTPLAAVHNNNAVRGFWLIKPDGTKSVVWDYFHRLLTASSKK